MRDATASIAPTHRQDYRPPDFRISTVDLVFDLDPARTQVTSTLHFQCNSSASGSWRLDGEGLELLSIAIDDIALQAGQDYELTDKALTIHAPPANGVLRTEVAIRPASNTHLEGLYVSSGNFFTQCEAEGFRRITFFPDRPDVMACYTVTLRAAATHHPVLLSNGNLKAQGPLDDGRHFATWEDPFPKPCYLFALVAGNLVCEERSLTLANGKTVLLQVWVEPGNLDKTAHAMASLVKSIQWDERRFGLELDLDRFMIVAVGDFNMGAMENKGLNIFNAKFVLAHPTTATDIDYDGIESVVGHEYFHNWTGNRVTCRDWFQLSLKEGLTVFRDQEFSADMMAAGLDEVAARSARAVKRIEDVKVLRAAQFAEDAGPMAHPIRPDSYVEINNFYTVTVYEKGAEVVRMQHTLLGEAAFRRGMDLYFQRHDGQAVTCDDFVDAMETAWQERQPTRSLRQFRLWYGQAGTPCVRCTDSYDAAAQRYTLTLAQSCPPTPGQPDKLPFHIPFAVGLLGADGQDIVLRTAGHAPATTITLDLTDTTQSFVFNDITSVPVPSLLRGFSAPVTIDADYSRADLLFLLKHDSDPFNRWEATQRLFAGLLSVPDDAARPVLRQAIELLLNDPSLSPAYRALILQLPNEATLAEQQGCDVDPQALHARREAVLAWMGDEFADDWQSLIAALGEPQSYHFDPEQVGRRALKNLAVGLLCKAGRFQPAEQLFASADNMTDQQAALTALVHCQAPAAAQALAAFEAQWAQEALVMDKWFAIQATAPEQQTGTTLSQVRRLLTHPQFSWKTPNRIRALIGNFCLNNPAAFLTLDGAGCDFWADQVIALDTLNPSVAARLARALDRWRLYTPAHRLNMQSALQKVAAVGALSAQVREIVDKAI
jgi:aminopeptidase N